MLHINYIRCPSKCISINELNHSVTEFNAKGVYNNEKNKVLFTVIPTKEYYKFKEGIEEMAPTIGNAVGEIAKGIKKGLNDADKE